MYPISCNGPSVLQLFPTKHSILEASHFSHRENWQNYMFCNQIMYLINISAMLELKLLAIVHLHKAEVQDAKLQLIMGIEFGTDICVH